jgi:hypothetical protein
VVHRTASSPAESVVPMRSSEPGARRAASRTISGDGSTPISRGRSGRRRKQDPGAVPTSSTVCPGCKGISAASSRELRPFVIAMNRPARWPRRPRG